MKIIVIGNYAPSLVNFRGALLAEFAGKGHEVIACSPGEQYEIESKLKSIGVRYKPVNLNRTGINPFKDLIFFLQQLYLFYREKPDLVLNYTIKPVIYGSLAAKLAGTKEVYSIITGLGYLFIGSSFKQKLLRMLSFRIYQKALSINKVIFFQNNDDLICFNDLRLVRSRKKLQGDAAETESGAEGAADEDLKTEAIVIGGSGIDLERYKEVSPQLKRKKFLLIARLIKDKGIHEYMEAAKMLKKKYADVVFQIVGPFDSNPTALRPADIQKWHQDGIIEYLGETSDVRRFISECSVYVLPSYREGTPRTVLEAMAMGRPVVSTDVPGCRETVVHGENGFLVPARNAAALAEAIEKFILDPDLIWKMGKRSREIAEDKFDVRKVNNVILRAMGMIDEKGI